MVKPGPGDGRSLLFSQDGGCDEWVAVPLAIIEEVEYLAMAPCRDHQHPMVRLYIQEPSAEDAYATALANLLRSAPSPEGDHPRKRPCPQTNLPTVLADRDSHAAASDARDVPPIKFSWPASFASGDCNLAEPELTIQPDGGVTFRGGARSPHPSPFGGDIYHLWFTILDAASHPIQVLPEISSPPITGSGYVIWSANLGIFPALQARFGDIRSVSGKQHC